MTKHSENKPEASPEPDKASASSEESSKGTLGDGKSQIKQQGEVYQGKKTYFVKGTDVGRENQKSNERLGQNGKQVYPTKDLKVNGQNGGEKNNKFEDKVKKFCKNLETLKKTVKQHKYHRQGFLKLLRIFNYLLYQLTELFLPKLKITVIYENRYTKTLDLQNMLVTGSYEKTLLSVN